MKCAMLWLYADAKGNEERSLQLSELQSKQVRFMRVYIDRGEPGEDRDSTIERWNEDTAVLRRIASRIAGLNGMAYFFGTIKEADISELKCTWNKEDYWIASPSGFDARCMLRRTTAARLQDETWWPSRLPTAAVVIEDGEKSTYGARLQEALFHPDCAVATRLMIKPRSLAEK